MLVVGVVAFNTIVDMTLKAEGCFTMHWLYTAVVCEIVCVHIKC